MKTGIKFMKTSNNERAMCYVGEKGCERWSKSYRNGSESAMCIHNHGGCCVDITTIRAAIESEGKNEKQM